MFKVYSDLGFTGSNINRPALINLINDIKEKKIDLVVSYKIDRLTRSPKDFYQLIELFDKYNVNFISVTERSDTSTPSGRLLRNIMLTFAQFERELTSERTKDKMLHRAQKGMWNGGFIPFGYKPENKKLVLNKDEAKIVQSIYEMDISGVSVAKISHKTNLSKGRIFTMLRNPIYIGQIRIRNKEGDLEEIVKGAHKGIITEEVFYAVVNKEKDEIMSSIHDAIKDIESSSEQFKVFFLTHFTQVRKKLNLYSVIIKENAKKHIDLFYKIQKESLDSQISILKNIMLTGMKKREFQKIKEEECEALVTVIIMMLQGMDSNLIFSKDKTQSIPNGLEKAIDVFIKGLKHGR